MNNYYLSLGWNCHVKFYLLKQKHIINRPNDLFDYCGSTFININELLKDIINNKNIEIKPEIYIKKDKDKTKIPRDPIYGLRLIHDIKIKNNKLLDIDISILNIKYKRKIERFINLLKNPDKNIIINFVRLNEPLDKKIFKNENNKELSNHEFEEIFEFINILDNNFAHLNYKIHYLIEESIDISNIINKYPDKLFILKTNNQNEFSFINKKL